MIKLAYVGAHLSSYLADENDVFANSIEGLKLLSDQLDFELVTVHTHISTRLEARDVAGECEAAGIDLVLLQNSTFAMGDLVLEFVERSFRLAIWATEEPLRQGPIPLNNFVSMNLQAGILNRYLQGQDIPFKWFYGYPEHPWFGARLKPTLSALRAIKGLATARIGLLGGVAPTFLNMHVDERVLRQTLGSEVGHHELSELFASVESQPEEAIQQAIAAMTKAANGRVEISERDLHMSAAIYLALKDFASEHSYDALAVSDWPVFQSELQLHPGMAFSFLDDQDNIPVASEGDVLGAVSMLIMNEINQGQALLLDMNDLDLEREAVLMWHCGGSPLGFADSNGVRWTNHSTLGRKSEDPPMGAVADYVFAPQQATIMRLSNDSRELLVVEAEIIESPHAGFDGSRGWLSHFCVDSQGISLSDLVNTIMVEGIEHHFILGSGHHSAALFELAAWLDIDTIKPIKHRAYLQRPSKR